MDISKPKSSKITPETSYNRACDMCRHHKVRCLPGTRDPSKTCQRCEKMDRSCVFTAPQKRKQRKRTDTRVAELEREVHAMRALFDPKPKRSQLGNGDGDGNVSKMQISDGADDQNNISGPASSCPPPDIATSISGSSPQSSTGSAPVWTPAPFSADSDVIDRGIISIEQAEQLLQIYNADIVENYHPIVVFSPELSAKELRRTKPTLFLAVIAAASGKVSPTLLSVLNSEALTAYAHRTIINGEKSLELVQAMIITCIWYNPPGKFSRLKFYEYIHMAVVMAIDLGYGTNPRGSRNRRGDMTAASITLSDLEVEQRRTFLLCFVISLNAAISLRRPNMLRYNPWLDECIETLDNLPNVSSSDKSIIAWVRLARITEDIQISLSFDDISNVANLSDTRTQMMICGFEKALQGWKKSVESMGNKSLLMAYHHTQIFLHEPALHDDHPPEHFRPPFAPDTLFTHSMDSTAKCAHIEATTACACHAHSLLDVILSMSMGELRSVPILVYVRMVYAVIILTKIYISSKSPSSEIGSSFDKESLKLGFYLEALIRKLREASGPMECRAPLTFLGLLVWIRIWYTRQEHDAVFSPPTNLPERSEACMIPPVSYRAFAEDQYMNDQLFNKFNGSMPRTEEEKADTAMTGKNSYDFDLEFDQEFEPFELAGLDPDFNAWNADMSMDLPLVLNDNYELPDFDWGFPPRNDGAL